MDEQAITQYIAQIISGSGGLILLIFKYREVIEFICRAVKLLYSPIKWTIALLKMPLRLNEEAIAARKRMDNVEKTINDLNAFVKKELTYNGGSSTLDAIRRIENRIIEQEYSHNALLLDSEIGVFKCDLVGSNKWVNRTYARYLGCGTNELIGYGWKRFILTQELLRYNSVWQAALKDGCEFEDVVEFVDTDHNQLKLRIVVCPIIDDKGKLLSYVGTVVPL